MGGRRVADVEISSDSGETWTEAERFDPDYAGAWRLFRISWNATPGTHTLVSRATDERGRTQPAAIGTSEEGFAALESGRYSWDEGGYAANPYPKRAHRRGRAPELGFESRNSASLFASYRSPYYDVRTASE